MTFKGLYIEAAKWGRYGIRMNTIGLDCFQVLLEPRTGLPLQTPTAAGTRRCTRGFGRRGGVPGLGRFPLVTGQVIYVDGGYLAAREA